MRGIVQAQIVFGREAIGRHVERGVRGFNALTVCQTITLPTARAQVFDIRVRLGDVQRESTDGGVHCQAEDACIEVHVGVLGASIAREGIVEAVVERTVAYLGLVDQRVVVQFTHANVPA